MNNSQKLDIILDKSTQTRYSIFKNQLFTASEPRFSKIPLHFKFTLQPTFVLDHGTTRKPDKPDPKVHCSRKRGSSSKTKIFQKRRSMSLKSGLLSTTEEHSCKDTISSQGRIRKGSIFSRHKTVPVGEEKKVFLEGSQHDQAKIMNGTKKQQYATPLQEFPENNQLSRHNFLEQTIYTPEEFRRMKCKPKDRKKVLDEPLKPVQFFNLMAKVVQEKRSRKSNNPRITARMVSSIIPVSPSCPKQRVSQQMNQQNWIYRI